MEEVGRHECRSIVRCLRLATSTLPVGDDVDDELCAMFDGSSELTQCTLVLPEEGLGRLGYGPVVPFLARLHVTGSPFGFE